MRGVAAILSVNMGMGTHAVRRSRDAISRYANSVAANRTQRLVVAFLSFLLLTVVWFAPVIVHLRLARPLGPADWTLSIRAYWAIHEQGGTPFTFHRDYLNGSSRRDPLVSRDRDRPADPVARHLAFQPAIGFIGGFNVFLARRLRPDGLLRLRAPRPARDAPDRLVLRRLRPGVQPVDVRARVAGHAAFTHLWIYLALILALLRMSERRTIASAALAGLCFGGTFLLSSYFGLLGAIVVGDVLRVRARPGARLAGEAVDRDAGLRVLGVTLLCLLPGLIAYKLDQENVASLITRSSLELQQ